MQASPSSYVSTYGQRLRQMAGMGQQPMMMQPAALDQSVEPQGPGALDAAPQQGALDQPAKPGRTIHDVAGELTKEEREQITKSLEDQGLDVESEYEKLVKEKHIDAGMIKKGEDGKLDKNDMGLFLIEFGLNQMKNGGKPGADTLSSTGAAALDTMDARRSRASEDEKRALLSAELKDRRNVRKGERIDKALESAAERKNRNANTDRDIAARAAEGKQRSEDARLDRESRERTSKDDNISRERQVKMSDGKDKATFVDEETGDVYWKDSQEQVMVPDGKGGKRPLKGKTSERGMTEKDFIDLTERHAKEMGDNAVTNKITVGGKTVTWMQATPEQKEAYLDSYEKRLRARAGKSQPAETPAWAK
jgi:hypothetical protein